jgi:hypothetical protein
LGKLPTAVAFESQIYADAAYTDYHVEDDLKQAEYIRLLIAGKSNSKQPDAPCLAYIKE